jgi:hypothetical protein
MKALALATALLSLVSCAAEEIVIATSDRHEEDGGHHIRPCATNSECHLDEFCAKVGCYDAMGSCARRPAVCGAEPDPFCGCDGVTYFNDCWRKTRGVAAATRGECDAANAMPCGGSAHAACPLESYCAELLPDGPIPMCPTDAPGTCWVLPTDCGPMDLINRWMPCGPPAPCVDTCNAIRSGVPHWRAPGCP